MNLIPIYNIYQLLRRRKTIFFINQTFCACLNSEDTCSDFLEQRKLFSSKDYNSFSADILPKEILLKVSNRIFCGFDAIYTARNTFICHRKRSWKTDGSGEIECLHALNVCSIQRSCRFPEKLEMSFAAYIVTQQDLGRHALNFPPNAICQRRKRNGWVTTDIELNLMIKS